MIFFLLLFTYVQNNHWSIYGRKYNLVNNVVLIIEIAQQTKDKFKKEEF